MNSNLFEWNIKWNVDELLQCCLNINYINSFKLNNVNNNCVLILI